MHQKRTHLHAERHYLSQLVQAWAAGSTTPVPLPAGVSATAVSRRLRAHNIEAALAPLLPPEVLTPEFAAEIAVSRTRSTLLLLECERLLPALGGSDWQPVLLKGAALALATYADPSDRWFLDLDILVPRPEVADVCRRLAGIGYRDLRGRRDPLFYEKYHLHRIMLGPQGSVVEIHWDLTIPGSVYSHDVPGVSVRAERRQLGRCPVLCAAPVDQILHGVYQHIADGFVDLRRVLDLVLLSRHLTPADWAHLVAEARRTGMQRALFLSLHIMKSIAEVDCPREVEEALDPGFATRRILRGLDVAEACLDRHAAETDGFTQMLHLLLTPTARLRAREVLRSLWVGEDRLLDQGYDPKHLPGFIVRSKIGLRQVKSFIFFSINTAKAFVTG